MKLKMFLATLVIMLGISATIYAKAYETPICITVNGSYLAMDEKPFLENGITYVPIRFLSEIFNADDISWDSQTNRATIKFSGKTVVVENENNIATVNGKNTQMNGPAKIVNKKLYVPVRFFAETFGSNLNWVQNYYRVELTSNNATINNSVTASKSYDDDHIYWLAKIINCESKGENIQGKIGVGNVILNRVESKDFPNTIYGVIFDDNYGVQFQPVSNGTIYNEPEGESYLAAKLALEGENTAGNSLYFLNQKIATNFWIPNNRTYFTSVGNHDFYL